MHAQTTRLAARSICLAEGYGIQIHVYRGHLIVRDGVGRQRRQRRYHRATSGLKRLVIVGHTGYITLEALRWLHDIGAAVIHIDSDGKLITTSTAPGAAHPALRRAQALAATNAVGVEVARELLREKVLGQASLLPELQACADGDDMFLRALDTIRIASDLSGLVAAEAEAAGAYWGAWSSVPVRIGSRDAQRVPDHWHTFGTRHSVLSNGPRLACNPPNAVLNYLYALLEAETILACHAVGLDPMLGVFHTDQRSRSSLALDAMEPVRPMVDAYVLALLTQRTLARADFAETRQRNCRVAPRLASRLAETIENWRHHVAPVVEGIAHMLSRSGAGAISIAAPLTRAQHHAAWEQRGPNRQRRPTTPATPVLPNACRDCGTHLPDRRKRYCDHCRAQRWARHAEQGRDNAASVLARMRAEQRDPAHGGRAAELRGRKNAEHQSAVRDWQGERPDPAVFAAEIQTNLRQVTIQEMVAATGLSAHYCSLIRLGKKVPHPRHWDALRRTGRGYSR